MGCKCEKIKKLHRELKILDEINMMSYKLSKMNDEVRGDLATIADAIPTTLSAPDESKLRNDVVELNKDMYEGLHNMCMHTDMAMAKVQKLLIKAEKEDDAYHKTHKKMRVMEASYSQGLFLHSAEVKPLPGGFSPSNSFGGPEDIKPNIKM